MPITVEGGRGQPVGGRRCVIRRDRQTGYCRYKKIVFFTSDSMRIEFRIGTLDTEMPRLWLLEGEPTKEGRMGM